MRISIIIPIYNGEKYLEKCLESISNQTYPELEVILVNDGSTDTSKEICEKWARKDCRFNLYNNENQGVSSSRNFGIKQATGEYITFVDCDDFLAKDALEILLQTASQGYDLIIANHARYYDEQNVTLNVDIPTREYNKKEFLDTFWKLYDSFVINSPWGKLYKKEILQSKKIEFPTDYELGEDLIFNLQYIEKSNTFYTINQNLYYYRDTTDSLTTKYNENYLKIQLELNRYIEDFLIRNNACDKESQEKLKKDVSNIIISSVQNLFLPSCPLNNKQVKEKLKKYLARQEIEVLVDVSYSEKRLQLFKKMIEKKKVKTIILYSRTKERIRKLVKRK